jgi:hypothetical protein
MTDSEKERSLFVPGKPVVSSTLSCLLREDNGIIEEMEGVTGYGEDIRKDGYGYRLQVTGYRLQVTGYRCGKRQKKRLKVSCYRLERITE